MLHLITGRIGSGKTAKIYSDIEKRIDSGEKDIILIVPEQYSFETEKNIINSMGALKADNVRVFSFTFLAKYLLREFGSVNLPELDDSIRAVLMSVALEQISDKLDIYSKSAKTSGFLNEMLGMVKELRQYAVSPDDLLNSASEMNDGILKNKVSELSLILRAYTATMEQSYFDDETSLDRLHDLPEGLDWFKDKSVFFDGFRGFTAQEIRLFDDIIPRAKDVFVTVCTDRVMGSFDKYSVFAHTRKTARNLISINDKHFMPKTEIISLQGGDYYNSPELAHLEKELYSVTPDIYTDKVDKITICCAESFQSECDFVAATVKKLISENSYRCRDIAIISRDGVTYEASIKSSLKKFEVPVYVDKRQPIMTQPLINFVNAALEIADSGFTNESIMRLLKTGLTDISEDDISQLENYAVMWKINGSRWCEEFKGHPDGLGNEMLEKHAEILEKINETRKTVTHPLYRFREALKNSTGSDGAKAIFNLLEEFNVSKNLKVLAVSLQNSGETQLYLEQGRIWDILMEILDSIASVLNNLSVTPKRFNELFNTMVSRFSMGALPVGLDEVMIGSAERVLTSSPKVIFAVGANEGVFPYIQLTKSVLSRNERAQLKAYGIDLGQDSYEDVIEERFIAYKTLCAATDKLYVSYSGKTVSGGELSPSELVSQVKKIFPEVKVIDTAFIDNTEFLRSRKASFELLAKNWRRNDDFTATLKEYFSNDEDYKTKLKSLSRVAEKKPFAIEDSETAIKLFGRDMYMSATRVETFYKCPFAYYCKYGIRAKAPKSAELDPMQKGTVLHYVLEVLIKTYSKDTLCAMSKEELDKCVMDILESYFEKNMSPLQEHSERFSYLYSSLGKTVCAVVQRLIAEFSVCDFVPVDFELPIDIDSEVKPLEIDLTSGGKLKLTGSVDRVDMLSFEGKKYVRVIDYKSGGKNFRLGDVFYGLNMQMLIYLFSILKNGTGKYSDVLPAGVLYMPVKATVTELPREASDDEVLLQQMKDCKMNGIILDDPVAIIGMDNGKSGLFIPVKFNEKTSEFSGSLITDEQMNALVEKVEGILKEMGDMLHNGRIEALPVFSSNSSSAYADGCTYCDYKSVCGFEADDDRKEILSLTDNECFAILKEKGGEENA